MLYPGNAPFLGRPPSIMHYGADYTFGDKKAYFNKMSHQQLRLETCPNFLFDEPWDGTVLAHSAQLSKQDALSTEHLATLNAAFCRFYARIGCSPLPERCGGSAASAFVVQRVHWLPPLLHWAASPSGDWRRGGSFGLAWHGWVAWSVCLLLASPRSDRRRTSTPSSPRSRTVVSGHVEGPSPSSLTRPRSRCPEAAAAGCLSWPVRAKQWHAASCKEFNTGDEMEMCASWAKMGECSKNPLFMHRSAYTEWFDFPGPQPYTP